MILFRYLSRELAGTIMAVTLVLVLIVIGNRLIQQLALAASGDLPLNMVFYTVFLRLPSLLGVILPLALFIGILLSYGRLYAESEMTVMTATGLSDGKILRYTLIFSSVITLLVAFCTLYVSPWGAQKLEDIYAQQAKMNEFDLLSPGAFQEIGSGKRVIYIEGLAKDNTELHNVFIADENSLLVAKRGTQYSSPETGSRFLELHEGHRYQTQEGSLELSVLDFDTYGAKIANEASERRQVRKEAIPTQDLWTSSDPLYQSQLQWRISLILMVPIITVIAFSLSKVNPRQGRFAKIFPALILFMVYLALVLALVGMIEKQSVSAWLGTWWLHILYALIALGLIGVPEWRRRRVVKRLA